MRGLLNLIFSERAGGQGNLSRINHVTRLEDGTYRKEPGLMFRRGLRIYYPDRQIQREIEVLEKLQPSVRFPRVLSKTEAGFVMSDMGAALCRANLPQNWKDQCEALLSELSRQRIIHRDIKPANLAVKDGIIGLLDFGWAIYEGEEAQPCPRELTPGIPRELVYDNRTALLRAIHQVMLEEFPP